MVSALTFPNSLDRSALKRLLRSRTAAWGIATLFAATASSSAESPWPQFRGPDGQGHATATKVPVKFGPDDSLTWRTEADGRGWSSPVIADGKIWLTSAIETQADKSEIQERMRKSGVKEREMKSREIAARIELRLQSFSVDDGKRLDDVLLRSYADPDAIHALNSYASPTPVIQGDRIFCHFGTYGTFCVDTETAESVWNHDHEVVHAVGPGSSPIVAGEMLILILDGCERQRVLALRTSDGSVVWEKERPEMDAPDGDRKKAFCTPLLIRDEQGQPQLICMASQYMVSYDVATGDEWWRCYHGTGFSVVPRPVYERGRLFFCTGFGKPELWSVGVDGRGDVSRTHVRWTYKKSVPAKPSPILVDGLIYMISDNGVATCLQTEDGKVVWTKRIGGNYSASPILAGELLYWCSQEGKVTVMTTGPEAEIIAENEMGERIMASPAAVGESLFLRTDAAMYRFDPS